MKFWSARNRASAIYGHRISRDDGWMRLLISKLLRFFIFCRSRIWIPDANVPYRLFRKDGLLEELSLLHSKLDLANAGLAALHQVKRSPLWIPIGFRARFSGSSHASATASLRRLYNLLLYFPLISESSKEGGEGHEAA